MEYPKNIYMYDMKNGMSYMGQPLKNIGETNQIEGNQIRLSDVVVIETRLVYSLGEGRIRNRKPIDAMVDFYKNTKHSGQYLETLNLEKPNIGASVYLFTLNRQV